MDIKLHPIPLLKMLLFCFIGFIHQECFARLSCSFGTNSMTPSAAVMLGAQQTSKLCCIMHRVLKGSLRPNKLCKCHHWV